MTPVILDQAGDGFSAVKDRAKLLQNCDAPNQIVSRAMHG